jgi:hypothetical protein
MDSKSRATLMCRSTPVARRPGSFLSLSLSLSLCRGSGPGYPISLVSCSKLVSTTPPSVSLSNTRP